jgi:preprotein translocase subunit SecE
VESTNSKILTVSYLVIGLITGIVVNVFIDTMAAIATGSFSRVLSADLVKHGMPVALGALAFFVLQFNKPVNQFAEEVVVEIRKVVWPTRKDTMSMTTVVCIMLIISGFVLGFFDMTSAYVVDFLLHINFERLFS